MTVFIKVGEFITLQGCLVMAFVILAALTSVKFGLLFRVAKPILMFLAGLSVGAYLTNLVNTDYVAFGAILGGIIFLVATPFITSGTSSPGV
jgi:hypothetical protein